MASWYIDTGTQRIWKLPIRSPITDFRFERGSAEPIAVRFVTDGTVVELGGSATVTLGFKQTPTSASYIIPSVTATKTGTGTSTVYTALPTFLSTDLDTYLSTADSKVVYMQVEWVDGTTTAQTPLYLARVSNNVNRGGETMPGVQVTQGVTYLSSVTRLTGGVAATDLDAVATASLTLGAIIKVVTGGIESEWKLQTGTATTDTAAGVIRPTDYNVSTNPRNLVRVAGAGYKVYAALLTQAAFANPSATVLQNTLGGTVVWTRNSNGDYTGTLSGAFTVGKVPSGNGFTDTNNGYLWEVQPNDINSVALTTRGAISDNLADDILSNTFIEIRVYNS